MPTQMRAHGCTPVYAHAGPTYPALLNAVQAKLEADKSPTDSPLLI